LLYDLKSTGGVRFFSCAISGWAILNPPLARPPGWFREGAAASVTTTAKNSMNATGKGHLKRAEARIELFCLLFMDLVLVLALRRVRTAISLGCRW